jgi:UDP-N-acetylmuramoyl-tripeptide--D-alanyl-D-alanine ligase
VLFERKDLRAYWLSTFLTFVAGLIITQGAWLALILANILLKPVQKRINASFVSTARERLREINPIVIGVAGSYGKTSTKFILETILAERFRVLKTPESYNNLLGISRVINSQLQPDHEVFIVELGGYRRGDIKKSTDLVHPQIGIIAAIGPEHLERLKTMENVEAMNYESIEALPASGVGVFNNDMERCRRLADKTTRVKVLRYGLDQSQPGLFLSAEEITQSSEGLRFTMIDSQGNRMPTMTSLLGRHNVLNILGAAAVAVETGMSLQEIGLAIPKIQQVPHRLQLLRGLGGVTVIDDAYNSNPLGANEALNVLKEFNGGKRILITPGMVELGELEGKANEEFGAKAAEICDYVLLVGARQTEAILTGLTRENFPKENIRIVGNLTEATQELQLIVKPGDVVLFENDLPDLYSEP